MIKKSLLLTIILITLLNGCTRAMPFAPTTAIPSPTTANPLPTTANPLPTTTHPSPATANPLPTTAKPLPAIHPTPTPYDPLSRAPITEAERLTAELLTSNYPPDRDDIALFVAYKGATAPAGPAPTAAAPLTVGARQNITVSNIDLNTTTSPEFVLQYVSDHAYFWFDTTPGLNEPTAAQLAGAGAGFDQIYTDSHFFFGPEANPGVDGDPRIHIVNASPLNLCDIGPHELNACGLGGYFSAHDLTPTQVNPASNGREMFVMNGRRFGVTGYLDTLAHEFRHMIEANYDVNDWDWAVEGSAMLAEELLGYPGDGVARANAFLQNPDQQLNRWTDGNPTPYYGQGYLLNRYIFNRLGVDLYREFAMHPEPAFVALDMIAQAHNLDFDGGMDLWLDWLAALAIHNHPQAPPKYALHEGVRTAVSQPLASLQTTVNQFAADYYTIPAGQKTTVTFTGSNHAPLLPVQPASGAQMWLANRANYSTARLTGAFDLTAVTTATLQYDVYHDIEIGYDFAYVAISADSGQTWQPLAGRQMQGGNPEDDPSATALAGRFYTGQSSGWLPETVDLTPHTGQELLLRFEYVTDPILTFGGLALDNIAIPEIGYFDDVETATFTPDGAWQAEGFVPAAAYVPQSWRLILITFNTEGPVITPIELPADNTAVIPIPDTLQDAVLIVAASAPMTLLPAHYQLSVTGNE